jgi:hypothetical protein
VDMRGEGKSNGLLLWRWAKHCGPSRKISLRLCREKENSRIQRTLWEIEISVADFVVQKESEKAKAISR